MTENDSRRGAETRRERAFHSPSSSHQAVSPFRGSQTPISLPFSASLPLCARSLLNGYGQAATRRTAVAQGWSEAEPWDPPSHGHPPQWGGRRCHADAFVCPFRARDISRTRFPGLHPGLSPLAPSGPGGAGASRRPNANGVAAHSLGLAEVRGLPWVPRRRVPQPHRGCGHPIMPTTTTPRPPPRRRIPRRKAAHGGSPATVERSGTLGPASKRDPAPTGRTAIPHGRFRVPLQGTEDILGTHTRGCTPYWLSPLAPLGQASHRSPYAGGVAADSPGLARQRLPGEDVR
jgi:hypothetical protein